MKSLIIVAAFAASLVFANPASAQSAPGRLTVSTAGLDLTSADGARALDLRILHAASAVCGTPSLTDARGRIKYEDCRAQARTAATVQRDQIFAAARSQVRLAAAK